MSADGKGGITPVRAIFQDVLPARNQTPAWLQKPAPEQVRPGLQRRASVPPPSAQSAQVQRKSDLPPRSRPLRGDVSDERRHKSAEPPRSVPDELYEERIQTARLAAELGESWQAPGGRVDDGGHQGAALALEEVHAALVALRDSQHDLLAEAETKLVALVRLVVERVIEREVRGDDGLALRLIREAIGSLSEGRPQITLGPAFEVEAAVLEASLEADGIQADITIDDGASPYACRVRSGLGDVDESLETRLDSVLAALEPEGENG